MNIKGGLAIIRSQLFSFTASKGFFWTLAIGWMTGPVIYLLVWRAASGEGAIGGYEANDFLLYYLLLLVVNQVSYPTTNWSTAENILSGGISKTLLRPVSLVYDAIACDAATKLVCVPFVILIAIGLGLFFQVRMTLGVSGAVLGVLAFALSIALRFLVAHTLSLLSFWLQRSDALLSVNDTFIFLFAGQVAPLAVFPGAMKIIAYCLPYRYMVSFPIEVALGKLGRPDIALGFSIQAIWLGAILLIHGIAYRRGIRRYSAVGG